MKYCLIISLALLLGCSTLPGSRNKPQGGATGGPPIEGIYFISVRHTKASHVKDVLDQVVAFASGSKYRRIFHGEIGVVADDRTNLLIILRESDDTARDDLQVLEVIVKAVDVETERTEEQTGNVQQGAPEVRPPAAGGRP